MSAGHIEERPVPFKKGDWVESKVGQLMVGTVKDCYWTSAYGSQPAECLVDLYLYNYAGHKVGRESPVLGGPKNFEPALSASDWMRIEPPKFPIEICRVPQPLEEGQEENERRFTLRYATRAKVLPDRAYIRKPRKIKPISVVSQKQADNGFNPEAEALALRLAAETLRDQARKFSSSPDVKRSLLSEAEQMETKAAKMVAEAHGS